MPDTTKGFKIWLPRTRTPVYSILIDGVDVTTEVISAEFVRGIIGVESPCKLTLIDADGTYATLYTGGETIEFKHDLTTGTTSQWKGTLETPRKQFGETYTLELIGSHYQSDLLDITVTEEYNDLGADVILKDIISKYLTGYTTTNITATTGTYTVKWNNKTFYDCVIDLCSNATFDCYVDSDKDFHFFEQESIENSSDVIVWNDNLLSISNFGTDALDVRNRVIVYGEDESGMPIVYQADDTTSQTANGIKEKVVKDSSIRTYEQAKDMGDGLLAQEKDKANKGDLDCLLLSYINPGDMIWITHPVQNIHGTFRIIKYIHTIPIERTKVLITKDKTIPAILRDRKRAELASENLTNPFKMTGSLNLPFDVVDDYDSTASSDISISESNLQVASGKASGVMVSKRRVTSSNVSAVHLKVIGDALAGNTYFVSANDGGDWEEVSLETETSIAAVGTNLRIKINLTDTNTRVDSIVCMYK